MINNKINYIKNHKLKSNLSFANDKNSWYCPIVTRFIIKCNNCNCPKGFNPIRLQDGHKVYNPRGNFQCKSKTYVQIVIPFWPNNGTKLIAIS